MSVSFFLGAFGYFEVTHDITKYSKAKVFEHIGKRTPLAVRFSTVGKSICLWDWYSRIFFGALGTQFQENLVKTENKHFSQLLPRVTVEKVPCNM